MKGDKRCVICNKWLGNYLTGEAPEGSASYYSIIKRKYCPGCNIWKRAGDIRFNQREYRRRKRKLEQEKDRRLLQLSEEVQDLRELIAELRDK